MIYIFIFLLLCTNAFASPPTRLFSYSSGSVIDSSDVTDNENAIFNYLQGGVDTISDNSIVNADVASNANIQSEKLNLTAVAQSISNTGTLANAGAVTITSGILYTAKGADVASAASMTLGTDGNMFDITGTTGITSITIKTAGTIVFLQFDSSLTVTDGSNLLLNGNFSATANDMLTLISDGTNWHEVCRSNN